MYSHGSEGEGIEPLSLDAYAGFKDPGHHQMASPSNFYYPRDHHESQ